MRIFMRLLAALIALVGWSHAQGQDQWDFAAPSKSRCSEGPQMDMNACMKREAEKVERAIDEHVRTLDRTLREPAAFRRAQSAWRAFRERECEFSNSGLGRGGSLYPYAQFACRIDLGEKRIKDLGEYVQAECNDCPPKK